MFTASCSAVELSGIVKEQENYNMLSLAYASTKKISVATITHDRLGDFTQYHLCRL